MAALFGYMSFAAGSTATELEAIFTDNILKAPYHKEGTVDTTPIVVYISLFGMCLVVGIATPFTVLPSKDSIEEIKNRKFTPKENVFYTFLVMTIGAICAAPFTTLSTPMAILGATTNSAIGFWLPIYYYIKIESKGPKFTTMKTLAYCLFIFIAISSVMEIILLIASFF